MPNNLSTKTLNQSKRESLQFLFFFIFFRFPTFFVWFYLSVSCRRASLRVCRWYCSPQFASAGLIIQWFHRQEGILGAQTRNNTRTPGLWRQPLFLPNNVFTLMSAMLGRPREVFSICALAPGSQTSYFLSPTTPFFLVFQSPCCF